MKALIAIAALAVSLTTFTSKVHAADLNVGDTAPCVVLNHLYPNAGEQEHCIRDPEQEGQLVLLEFFSARCSDCRRNLPKVSQLHRELGEGLTVRLVDIDRQEDLLRSYFSAQRSLINFSMALDTSRDAKRAYGVFSTPTLFILNSENTVI